MTAGSCCNPADCSGRGSARDGVGCGCSLRTGEAYCNMTSCSTSCFVKGDPEIAGSSDLADGCSDMEV